MTRRRGAALVAAALVVAGFTATPAGADQLTIDDAANDVQLFDAGTPTNEPRVDITKVEVDHQARSLRVAITVAQVTPLDDPAWENLSVSAALVDPDEDPAAFAGFRIWSLIPVSSTEATGELLSLSDDGVEECDTAASVDVAARQYVLTADQECVRDLPRSLRVAAGLSFAQETSEDGAFDQAPDDDFSQPVASSGAPVVERIAGTDRIATAIALSADRFDAGDADVAVLASSVTFPDAIAGGPLAVSVGGPLLLTPADHLDPRVSAELQRVVTNGGEVLVMGGTGAVSDAVLSGVRDLGLRPRRVAGATRFETAVAAADAIGDHANVVIADGRSFREALIGGAAAAARGGVVVLTDGNVLPGPTDDYLAHDPMPHVAIGGAAAAAPGAERITAGSTAELSQKVLDRLLPLARSVAVAGDATFADALAGAPHLASLGAGLLLTNGSQLSPPVAQALQQRKDGLREVVIYGGTAAVSPGVEQAITTAVT